MLYHKKTRGIAVTEFNMEDFEERIIERSKLTKKQFTKELLKESAYDYLNEEKELSYHFIKSVYENETIKSRRDSFFEKKSELDINWTIQMFNDREKKFRSLIQENPLIRSESILEFIDSVISGKTVARRVEAFFSKEMNQNKVTSKNDYLFLEKKYRDYILENRSLPIEQLAEKLTRWDKRQIVLKIKNIEVDETYKRTKKSAESIPLERETRRQSEMIAHGKGKIIKGASGEDRFVENDPWYLKWIFASAIALVLYLIFPDMAGIESDKDKYCDKYYKNYPTASRSDCNRSWKKFQN